MTAPGRPILFLAIMVGVMLLGAVMDPALIAVALVADVVLVAWCLHEGRRLSRLAVDIQREGGRRIQIDRPAEFVYRMENRSARALVVTLRQDWPVMLEGAEREAEVRLEPGECVRVAMSATPHRRGRVVLPAPVVDVRFPAGLAVWRQPFGEGASFTVYPDLQNLYAYDILRHSRALRQFGIHRQRIVGSGREFEHLREYGTDDDYRDINWKATARRRKPITNVYQAERSQDVLLCLDCARMMGSPIGKHTALDCAVDAAVMLAHAANRQGDRVGLVLFKESVDLFLKPASGASAVNRIIEELVDVESEGVFPSYAALIEAIRVYHKRRSMIFLFTDLNDPQLAGDLTQVLPLVSRQHVVAVLSLRDPILDLVAEGAAAERADVFRILAARQLATERNGRVRNLSKHGVQVLEADPESLSMEAINRYLSIKARQMV